MISFTLLQDAVVKDDPKLKPPPSPSGMKMWVPGINSFVKATPHAEQMLRAIEKEFKDKKRWTVVGLEQLKKNAAYTTLFNEKMHNWKNKIAPGEDIQFLICDGVLDEETGKSLTAAERVRLIQALGVDALAIVKTKVILKSPGGTLNGFGTRRPFATSYLTLYTQDGNNEKPVWEAWHEANEAEQSIGLTEAGLSQEKMNESSLLSAKRAMAELLVTTKIEK